MDDVGSIALSGVQAGFVRLAASAHNVANLTTEDFRPLRTQQRTQPGGGTQAVNVQSATPQPVDLPFEIVEQMRAENQVLASLRVLSIHGTLLGSLVDLRA